MQRYLASEEETIAFGKQLARVLSAPCLVYLSGDLGAGKTTFARAFLRELGVTGAIKSPTFSIVEPYQLDKLELYHFDLYRMADPEEIEFLGFRDYCHDNSIILLEWPEKARDFIPPADIVITLTRQGSGRDCQLAFLTPRGESFAPAITIE